MAGREAELAQAQLHRSMGRLRHLANQHAAIVLITRRARAGKMDTGRAIALIEALIDGHAVPLWSPTVDPNKSQLQIVGSQDAPPAVVELLRAAELPTLDPVEQSMLDARQGDG